MNIDKQNVVKQLEDTIDEMENGPLFYPSKQNDLAKENEKAFKMIYDNLMTDRDDVQSFDSIDKWGTVEQEEDLGNNNGQPIPTNIKVGGGGPSRKGGYQQGASHLNHQGQQLQGQQHKNHLQGQHQKNHQVQVHHQKSHRHKHVANSPQGQQQLHQGVYHLQQPPYPLQSHHGMHHSPHHGNGHQGAGGVNAGMHGMHHHPLPQNQHQSHHGMLHLSHHGDGDHDGDQGTGGVNAGMHYLPSHRGSGSHHPPAAGGVNASMHHPPAARRGYAGMHHPPAARGGYAGMNHFQSHHGRGYQGAACGGNAGMHHPQSHHGSGSHHPPASRGGNDCMHHLPRPQNHQPQALAKEV